MSHRLKHGMQYLTKLVGSVNIVPYGPQVGWLVVFVREFARTSASQSLPGQTAWNGLVPRSSNSVGVPCWFKSSIIERETISHMFLPLFQGRRGEREDKKRKKRESGKRTGGPVHVFLSFFSFIYYIPKMGKSEKMGKILHDFVIYCRS